MTELQTIMVSEGAIEYTYPITITETTGKTISADTVDLALGTVYAPYTARVPDKLTFPQSNQAVAQMLIGTTYVPPPGTYQLWWRITDSPEIAWRMAPLTVCIA